MKVVCVAPDGSLEVWERMFYKAWKIQRECPTTHQFLLDGFGCASDILHDPSFWGREVLGEL